MNKNQKAVLIIGFLLILATGIYPPWVQSWDFVAGGEDLRFRIDAGAEGYSWIFLPPAVPAWVEGSFPKPDDPGIAEDVIKDVSESGVKALLRSVRAPGRWRSRIDTSRLLVEWGMILAGVGAGLLLFTQGRSGRGTAG